MSEDIKPKLGLRPALGLNKTVEVGKVKQSFSHGRTKSVVVEVKRNRVLRRPGDPLPEAEVEAPAPPPPAAPPAPPAAPVARAPEPAPAPRPAAPPPPASLARPPEPPLPAAEPARPLPPPVAFTPVERPAPRPVERPVPEAAPAPVAPAAIAPEPRPTPPPARPSPTSRPTVAPARPGAARPGQRPAGRPSGPATDLLSRQERQALLLRQAEEDRLRAAEEANRRDEEARAAAAEAERQRIETKRFEAEELATRPDPIETRPLDATGTPIAAEEEDPRGPKRGTPLLGRRPEPPAKPARLGVGDRRQSGKLTVTRALDSEDSVRVRSLAALRRAREKDKRAHQSGAAIQRQVRDITVPESITVQELANRLFERANDVIRALTRLGIAGAQVDSELDQDVAELIVNEFGHHIVRVAESDVEIGVIGAQDEEADLRPRPPVVTIMGHVDHGKTSLLDALRGTNVVKGEAGGITQHIGAYQIATKGGEKITFLDTPGHEAFTQMRARGANVTDIVVLVVAWDDGVMPQTIEAINHTKAAGVPMIVAINKMDKTGADAQRIRTALLQYDVQVEALGGEVQDVEVSATAKTGLDDLVDAILLQAEVLELKANPNRSAEGTVIEAQLDKGRGPLATVLVKRGTLKTGDIFVVGAEWGKVRALVDDAGKPTKKALPSTPVEVLGLSGVPKAGDPFSVMETEARAREVATYRAGLATAKRTVAPEPPSTLEAMFAQVSPDRQQEYPLVVKGDTQGSVEAIVTSINKITTDLIKARILHSGAGGITESDVSLAAASKAPIIGFNVRPNAKAREIAQRDQVRLKYYDVIYDLLEDIRGEMAGQLGPEMLENIVGRAQVLDVFQAGKTGKAAGLRVTEGVIRKNLRARLTRDDVIIYNGSIASLRRFKDDVPEVRAGLECGVTLEGSSDVRAGDFLETFEVEERARTL